MSASLAAGPAGAEAAREACCGALRRDDLCAVERGLRRAFGSVPDCRAVVASVNEAPRGQDAVQALAAGLARGEGLAPGALERFLLLRSCLAVLDAVPDLPIPERVRNRVYAAFLDFADPPPSLEGDFQRGGYAFSAMCKIASLRRFPAGQFDWEISGIPRSFFVRTRSRDVPRMLWFVARQIGGLRPLLMPHFSLFRKRLLVMRPREVNRSYHQMAQALALQPGVRGMVASAWFYSPDTYRISPHLSWLRAEIASSGGFTTTVGSAGAESGALAQSFLRRQFYESSAFHPTEGLVIWPRAAMLRWAEAHPQYAE